VIFQEVVHSRIRAAGFERLSERIRTSLPSEGFCFPQHNQKRGCPISRVLCEKWEAYCQRRLCGADTPVRRFCFGLCGAGVTARDPLSLAGCPTHSRSCG
jgi:hypothetical protein